MIDAHTLAAAVVADLGGDYYAISPWDRRTADIGSMDHRDGDAWLHEEMDHIQVAVRRAGNERYYYYRVPYDTRLDDAATRLASLISPR